MCVCVCVCSHVMNIVMYHSKKYGLCIVCNECRLVDCSPSTVAIVISSSSSEGQLSNLKTASCGTIEKSECQKSHTHSHTHCLIYYVTLNGVFLISR